MEGIQEEAEEFGSFLAAEGAEHCTSAHIASISKLFFHFLREHIYRIFLGQHVLHKHSFSATVGGSIFGRFGFSDVLTCFLALDTYVELYKGGIVSLKEFVDMPRDNDILVRILIKKLHLTLSLSKAL